MQTLVNVSNRLPVTVGKTIRQASGGLTAALEGLSSDAFRLKWVGWPGAPVSAAERREEIAHFLMEAYNYVPVYLTRSEVNGHYHGFANSSLWPILHYMPNYMHYEERWWETYLEVNRRFAECILENTDEEAIIWVHDYQLMVLPRLLRRARPRQRIGFFLHTPFPSYEIFRCHPKRVELVEGLLGADLVGFHTYGYLRHFRSTVLRLLGVESHAAAVAHDMGHTHLGVYPIGINAPKFEAELASPRSARARQQIRKNFAGRRIVLSVERLDYTKGIPNRLDAIDRFLSSYPDLDRLVFIFVSVPSRESVPEYQQLRELVQRQVGEINGRYATMANSPIHFIYNPIKFEELAALYSLADVCLVTPLIDGMNLVAKEYVTCQDEQPGVLVLSEFAGAAEELFNALTVNPYDLGQVAAALQRALDMPEDERRQRMRQMRARVTSFDAQHWAKSFCDDLVQHEERADSLDMSAETESVILDRFRRERRIAFFLDYDGSLREFESEPHQASPDGEILELVNRIQSVPGVDLYIISGRDASQLEMWFGSFAVTLVAEHGYLFHRPGAQEWETLNASADFSWKPRVLEVLRDYEGETPGSFVEEKGSALVWHYRKSDPEFGSWKAHALAGELYEMLSNLPVEIHHGKKIVEVSSIYVNKGAAMERFMREGQYDLGFCAGDDQTDETMFRLQRDDALSVKIGEGATQARYRARDPRRFRALLRRILDLLESRAQ